MKFDTIVDLISEGSSVLDLGCGDCTLLRRLAEEKGVLGRGVDREDHMIQECIKKGVSVFHGDLDEGLKDHPTGSYDYVVLSRTLQMVHRPAFLLTEMVRVGRKAIVSFPNFAHVVNRLQLGILGRMPVNRHIPYQWYDTPNIHFFTYRDFRVLCEDLGIAITRSAFFRGDKSIRPLAPNLRATDVCCLIEPV